MEALGKFFATVLVTVITTLIYGYVFMLLWRWLITPVFGVAALTLIQAISVYFFIQVAKSNPMKKSDETLDGEFLLRSVIVSIVFGAVMLFFGFIISLFL